MNSPTYAEIADSFSLWQEYVDPSGLMSEEQFEQMSLPERMDFIQGCFDHEEIPNK